MIFKRPVAVVSLIKGILCTLFAFILVAEDSRDNDAGKVSTREGTVTASCHAAHRPEEGTNDLADAKGDHARIDDCIEREDDSPLCVSYFNIPAEGIYRVN